jgi:hypothetical protein
MPKNRQIHPENAPFYRAKIAICHFSRDLSPLRDFQRSNFGRFLVSTVVRREETIGSFGPDSGLLPVSGGVAPCATKGVAIAAAISKNSFSSPKSNL